MPVAYTCFAVQNPTFQPAMRLIAAITQADSCVVTTTFDHQYRDETIIRLDIPEACGMQQANQFFGPITVLSATTFSLPLDTTRFTPFVIPTLTNNHINICALSVPIGESNETLRAAVQNVLPYPLAP